MLSFALGSGNQNVCLFVLAVAAKDAEVKKQLEDTHVEVEEMKKRLKEQDRERKSELLKLQMEVRKKSDVL